MTENPFDSIESAHEYVSVLLEQVGMVKASLMEDVAPDARLATGRHADAIRLVDYKLDQLQHHLATSARLLNDLRVLRRLLLGERTAMTDACTTH